VQSVIDFVVSHGYGLVFATVFANEIGLPVPAVLFLLAAGALAADGRLDVVPVLALSVTASVLADWVWYEAGRRGGDRVLWALHRLAPDPEAAARRASRMFARFGSTLLLVAKFVPGLDAVVPPLAGMSGKGRVHFLALDAVGAALWAGAYMGLGHVFRRDLDRAAAGVAAFGRVSGSLVFAAGVAIAAVAVSRWRRARRTGQPVSVRAPVRRDLESLVTHGFAQAVRTRT
jgi:membrane protein DedA with SNARE-associated domain